MNPIFIIMCINNKSLGIFLLVLFDCVSYCKIMRICTFLINYVVSDWPVATTVFWYEQKLDNHFIHPIKLFSARERFLSKAACCFFPPLVFCYSSDVRRHTLRIVHAHRCLLIYCLLHSRHSHPCRCALF